MKVDILQSLNSGQKEAVSYVDGPSVILAGAGSGKTRVLIYKVAYLIKHKKIDPLSILMITFTNKAAGEMKKRINSNQKTSLGYVGTFHSFGALLLRKEGEHIGVENDYVIYDDDDQVSMMKSILKDKGIKKYTPSFVLNRISMAKNMLIKPDKYLKVFSDYSARDLIDIYALYEKTLATHHAVDFDDLIMKTVLLLTKNPSILDKYHNKFTHILVDEFQDTNYAQYALTKLLGKKYGNVTVVGDFSQSIYSWRGAEIGNLQKFTDDFSPCKVFYLEQNYRSSQKILDFAYKVIQKNESHPILKLYTRNIVGEDIPIYEAYDEEGEASYIVSEIEKSKENIAYKSMAVLYRTNAQSRIIEEAFLQYGIPYVLIGGVRFYERREVKDVLSYLRLLINPSNDLARDRIIKLGKKRWEVFRIRYPALQKKAQSLTTSELIDQIFEETGYLSLYSLDSEEDYSRLENIKELKSVASRYPHVLDFLQQVALVESEYSEGEKKRKHRDGVRLMTLHQAKGLEFPMVFIVGVEEGILPHVRAIDDPFQLEEERRLFYVGITRAKDKLYISFARRRYLYGRRGEGLKSRFLEDNESGIW